MQKSSDELGRSMEFQVNIMLRAQKYVLYVQVPQAWSGSTHGFALRTRCSFPNPQRFLRTLPGGLSPEKQRNHLVSFVVRLGHSQYTSKSGKWHISYESVLV